jgi:hypothetical protein
MSHNIRDEVRGMLINALKKELEGPLRFRYVTRYTNAFLKARHSFPNALHIPNINAPQKIQAAVDGSHKVLKDGTHVASGACAYMMTDHSTQPPTEEVHIVYCTFDGEQNVANGEISGLLLALQWLKRENYLQIGWNHLNGVKQAHHNIPGTKCTGRPHGMTAEHSQAYHQNPHMTTVGYLLQSSSSSGPLGMNTDEGLNRTRQC